MQSISTIELWIIWFCVSLLLGIAEILLPSFVLIWFSVGALITGILLLVFPNMPEWLQILFFSALSLTFLIVFRKYFYPKYRKKEKNSIEPHQRAKQYIGRVYHIEKDFEDSVGRIKIDDSFWRSEGKNIKAGMKVKIIKSEGNTLYVEPHQEK